MPMWEILSQLPSAIYTHQTNTQWEGKVLLIKAPGDLKRPDTHNRGRPKATGNAKIQQHNKFIE